MKSIGKILFAAGIALSIAGTTSAQDAAAPFRRSSPSPSPMATPKPAETPVPKPQPSPSAPPAPTATPALEPSPSPSLARERPEASVTPTPVRSKDESSSRRVLREKPVRAVEPRAPWIQRIPAQKREGPPASKPTFDLSSNSWVTNANIRSLENKWQAAVKAHDADALAKLLDDDFVATSASGKTASKARLLRELRNDKNVYRSAHVRGTSVRMIRPGVAVITGTITESGTKEDGERFTSSRRFSDTWNESKGVWKCTASEVTPLPKR